MAFRGNFGLNPDHVNDPSQGIGQFNGVRMGLPGSMETNVHHYEDPNSAFRMRMSLPFRQAMQAPLFATSYAVTVPQEHTSSYHDNISANEEYGFRNWTGNQTHRNNEPPSSLASSFKELTPTEHKQLQRLARLPPDKLACLQETDDLSSIALAIRRHRTCQRPTPEVNFNKFSILVSLCRYPELMFDVSQYLDVDTLLSLYAISKDFHCIANDRFTHLMKLNANFHVPESARIFRFTSYHSLCRIDPGGREHPRLPQFVRPVPSFRWLKMVYFRDRVVNGIIENLALEGLRLPKRAVHVLKKIWFMMDIPDNRRRIAYVAHKENWPKRDIYVATMIFLKLEMRFTEPEFGKGDGYVHKLFLAQKSLSTMWRCLRGEEGTTYLYYLRMFIRWKFTPQEQYKDQPLFGVPPNEIGKLHLEGWGKGRNDLLRPDEVIRREGIIRNYDIHTRFLDMMLYGFMDPYTLQEIPVEKRMGKTLDDNLATILDEDDIALTDSEVIQRAEDDEDDDDVVDENRNIENSNACLADWEDTGLEGDLNFKAILARNIVVS